MRRLRLFPSAFLAIASLTAAQRMRDFVDGDLKHEQFKDKVRGSKGDSKGSSRDRGWTDPGGRFDDPYGGAYNPELDCLAIVENKVRVVVALREALTTYFKSHGDAP